METNSARTIPDITSKDCEHAVKRWTQRVLDRDASIPPGLTFKWGTSSSTSVLFDVIMCNAWLADQWLKEAIKPDSHVSMAKKAAAHYKYVATDLFPRWTHRPAVAQQDPLSSIRAIVGKYYLCRAIEFDILSRVADEKNYSMALKKQLKLNSAHAYGNSAQLLPGKHAENWYLSISRSADALCALGQDILQRESQARFGQSAACFAEAVRRYTLSSASSELISKAKELQLCAETSNCSTHNAEVALPSWDTMSATV